MRDSTDVVRDNPHAPEKFQNPQSSSHIVNTMESMKKSDPINWVYINGLGERESDNLSDSDILTAIKFDKSGNYLAVGDKGGRVILFKYNELKNSRYFDYRYFTEI